MQCRYVLFDAAVENEGSLLHFSFGHVVAKGTGERKSYSSASAAVPFAG